MNTRIIRNWMTRSPITVTPHMALPEANRFMDGLNIHRLPANNITIG